MMRYLVIAAALVATALLGSHAALAATYAYVDTTGDVDTVQADNSVEAMVMAPGIDEHSGVLLVNDTADMQVVDDTVPGV